MRRIRRVVGVVDVRRVDADEAHSQSQEQVRRRSRQPGILEEVCARAPMPLPPTGAKEDSVSVPEGAGRRADRRLQVRRQNPAFLREAADVEDVTRHDESIERHLMELAAFRFEMERRIDVGAGVADQEQGFGEEPVDFPRGPLRERRRRIRREHLGVRPDGLGQVDDARESDDLRFRNDDLLPVRRRAPDGLSRFLGRTLLRRDGFRCPVPTNRLKRVASEIVACRQCTRLVRYRERVAHTKRAAFLHWVYWGRPVPGFGDPDARVLIVGLAPAAHGGNRTGRAFTGDRSGEFLYRALYRAGFANQPTSVSKDDGLVLRDCYIAAARRCAPPQNKSTRYEFARCQPYLEREVVLLRHLRVVVVLGAVAMQAFLRTWRATGHEVPSPVPKFRHEGTWPLPPITLIATYHPSQRNTQTGRLTQSMLDRVFESAQKVRSTGHLLDNRGDT